MEDLQTHTIVRAYHQAPMIGAALTAEAGYVTPEMAEEGIASAVRRHQETLEAEREAYLDGFPHTD